jgi:transposase-like protein
MAHTEDMTNLSLPKLADRLVDDYAAYEYLEELRWGHGPVCPHCGGLDNATFLKPRNEDGKARATRTGSMSQRRVWKCKNKGCRKQFSVITGTVMHGSKVPVRIWVLVTFQMAAAKNGMSAREVQRVYGLCPKTAWFVCHRIREAMRAQAPHMLAGTFVADETWIGGKPKNRHANKRVGSKRGLTDQTTVFSLVNAETGEIRSQVVADVTAKTLRAAITEKVDMERSVLHTDESHSYTMIGREFADHQSVNHRAGEYVRAGVNTNKLESYFAQLKRSIDGTHHHVSKEHLQRYLEEFHFLYSTCKLTDAERMLQIIRQARGKRLAYKVCR